MTIQLYNERCCEAFLQSFHSQQRELEVLDGSRNKLLVARCEERRELNESGFGIDDWEHIIRPEIQVCARKQLLVEDSPDSDADGMGWVCIEKEKDRVVNEVYPYWLKSRNSGLNFFKLEEPDQPSKLKTSKNPSHLPTPIAQTFQLTGQKQ